MVWLAAVLRASSNVRQRQCWWCLVARRYSTLRKPLLDQYDPSRVEQGWYDFWRSRGLFAAKPNASGAGQSAPLAPCAVASDNSVDCGEQVADLNNYPEQPGVFNILLPPPNVTGRLHIGHALTVAIEDALVRQRRATGHSVSWLPGLDHAGIATQSIVEKSLARQLGSEWRRATDMPRAEFEQHVWQWRDQHGDHINEQLRQTGASLDWDRAYFTLDEERSAGVREAFVRLFDAGLVYRAERLVHWCSHLRTAISDIEVDHDELDGPTMLRVPGHPDPVPFGVLWTVRYPLVYESRGRQHTGANRAPEPPASWPRYVDIATTRPETILADEAVAVHSTSGVLAELAGGGGGDDAQWTVRAQVPVDSGLLGGKESRRTVPIVVDDELVDPEFGTGAVKVTPAHDANDYACGVRLNLPLDRDIFDDAGFASALAGPRFQGQPRLALRQLLIDELDREGLLVAADPYPGSRVMRCSRSGDVLEPRLKPQWFVRCAPLAARAADLVRSGQLTVRPDTARRDWFRWLDACEDWCVSRQLWWGHRIPVYEIQFDDATDVAGQRVGRGSSQPAARWIAARNAEEARSRAAHLLNVAVDDPRLQLVQDEDVLDTWFSSGLLPLTALGWPQRSPPSDQYPMSLLETGSDILFFWVARMVMLCTWLSETEATNSSPGSSGGAGGTATVPKHGRQQRDLHMPFRSILLHPLVRDAQGRKMSKSLGNVIDPQHIIEGVRLEQMQAVARASPGLTAAQLDQALAHLASEYPDGIPACGADALRFALIHYMEQKDQINLDVRRVAAARRFCNKVWQASLFVLSKPWAATPSPAAENDDHVMSPHLLDLWIQGRLNQLVSVCRQAFRDQDLAPAAALLQRFFVNDFCDLYIEFLKSPAAVESTPASNNQGCSSSSPTSASSYKCAVHVLRQWLVLAHPFMPFITEELWFHLWRKTENAGGKLNAASETVEAAYQSISMQSYPTVDSDIERELCQLAVDDTVEQLTRISQCIRSLKTLQLPFEERLFFIATSSPSPVESQLPLIAHWAQSPCSAIHLASRGGSEIDQYISVRQPVSHDLSVYMCVAPASLNDSSRTDARTQLATLQKRLVKLRKQEAGLRARQQAANYKDRVPVAIQAEHNAKLESLEQKIVQNEQIASILQQAG